MAKPVLSVYADQLFRIHQTRERIREAIEDLQIQLDNVDLDEARVLDQISEFVRTDYERILKQRKRSKRC